jgi:hypothetical protein
MGCVLSYCCGPREISHRTVLRDIELLSWQEYDHIVRALHENSPNADQCFTYCCAAYPK